jgi:hypothetical protein
MLISCHALNFKSRSSVALIGYLRLILLQIAYEDAAIVSSVVRNTGTFPSVLHARSDSVPTSKLQ